MAGAHASYWSATGGLDAIAAAIEVLDKELEAVAALLEGGDEM